MSDDLIVRQLKAKVRQYRLQAKYWRDHCGFLMELVRAWKNRARAAERQSSHHKDATNKAQAEVDGHVI